MIGKKLHDLREAADLTQKTIAEAIGMDARYVSYWEKDHRDPALDSLKHLCEFFGVSADYMIGITNSKEGYQVSDDQARILNLIGSLNEHEMRQVELYVEFLLYKRRQKEKQHSDEDPAAAPTKTTGTEKTVGKTVTAAPAAKSGEYVPDESHFGQEIAEEPEGFAEK